MWDVFENTCRDYFAAIRWEKLQRKSLQGAQGFFSGDIDAGRACPMGHALNLLGLLHQFLEGLLNLAEVFGVEVDEFGCQLLVAVNEDDIAEFIGKFNLEEFQVGFPLPVGEVADGDVLNLFVLGKFDQFVLNGFALGPNHKPISLFAFLADAADKFLQLHRQTGGVLLRVQMHPNLDLRSHPILSDRAGVGALVWTCDMDGVVSGHNVAHLQTSVWGLLFLPL